MSQLWFSWDILKYIWLRDQAHLKFKKSGLEDDYLAFKNLRNLTQRKISVAKRDYILYIRNQLEENQSKPNALWKNLKELGMPTKSKDPFFKYWTL